MATNGRLGESNQNMYYTEAEPPMPSAPVAIEVLQNLDRLTDRFAQLAELCEQRLGLVSYPCPSSEGLKGEACRPMPEYFQSISGAIQRGHAAADRIEAQFNRAELP